MSTPTEPILTPDYGWELVSNGMSHEDALSMADNLRNSPLVTTGTMVAQKTDGTWEVYKNGPVRPDTLVPKQVWEDPATDETVVVEALTTPATPSVPTQLVVWRGIQDPTGWKVGTWTAFNRQYTRYMGNSDALGV